MKFINYIYSKAPMWILYLIGSLIMSISSFVLFIISNYSLTLSGSFKSSLTIGLFFGLFFCAFMHLIRNDIKFWDSAKNVEELIEKAETREDLENVFKNEFSILRKMNTDIRHSAELTRLHSLIKMKSHYIP